MQNGGKNMSKYKYEILFYDGYNERFFSFFAFDRNQALDILYELLERDGYKKNNKSKILSFEEKI